jgi:thiamine biosynthesis lipoprotein
VSSEPLTKKRLATLLAGLFLLILLTLWRYTTPIPVGPKQSVLEGETMGTYFVVKLEKPEGSTNGILDGNDQHLLSQIRLVLDTVDHKMSTYKEDSELSKVNTAWTTDPIPISEDLAHVISNAVKVNQETNGAFDITVGPIVNAYGFGPDLNVRPPNDDELAMLWLRVGSDKFSIDLDGLTLSKVRQDVQLDLSAIAKGYAVDSVAGLLDARGIENYFIEVGGEVRVLGTNHEGEPWKVGIEKPVEGKSEIHKVVELTNQSMATSGTYRNFYMEDGQRVSHTIDPRTGTPVSHNLVSVSVIHPNCELADAYATALLVLGPEEGPKAAAELGLEAVFIVETEDGLKEIE